MLIQWSFLSKKTAILQHYIVRNYANTAVFWPNSAPDKIYNKFLDMLTCLAYF